jgi:hypothetical protein
LPKWMFVVLVLDYMYAMLDIGPRYVITYGFYYYLAIHSRLLLPTYMLSHGLGVLCLSQSQGVDYALHLDIIKIQQRVIVIIYCGSVPLTEIAVLLLLFFLQCCAIYI